ncbi:hypothetical protein IJ579_06505 [bacterium]|nr:hypothetical protein [bacterium]
MYIFELLSKYFKKSQPVKSSYTSETEDIVENSEECNHLFMPLDSTNEYFACKYCGLVIKK